MTGDIHPLASHHLPSFIVHPGQTDTLMIVTVIFLLTIVVLVGSFYFVLHSLPERMSHKTNLVQMEIVAVLALISLFTHNHVFWIIALLLAFVRIPDFETPLYSIAEALQRLSGSEPRPRPVPSNPHVEPPEHAVASPQAEVSLPVTEDKGA
jgi:hypothetical protein